jgi:hypothetical protein
MAAELQINVNDKEKVDDTLNLKSPQGKKLNKRNISLIIAAVVLVIGSVGGVYAFQTMKEGTQKDSVSQVNHEGNENQIIAHSEGVSIPTVKMIQNPFNGTLMEEEALNALPNRPLAIMMDNSVPARQVQMNLNRADMVYEGLVEAGITRFMGIYYSDQSDFKVMPIRSVRMLYLDNLTEYNDILLYHVGGANTPESPKTDALNRLIRDKVKSVFYYAGNLWQSYNELYDADCAKNPGIPGYSCKYRFTGELWKKATDAGYQKVKWEPENKFAWGWKFNADIKESDKPATTIAYNFAANKGFDADWTYDNLTNKYLRKIDKKELIDHATNEQVWANTIVVQKIKYQLNVDDKQRVISTTDGTGEAYIFMKGKAYEVTWKKTCDPVKPKECRTRYYNKDDNSEFTFAPGKIWVSITRTQEKVTYN